LNKIKANIARFSRRGRKSNAKVTNREMIASSSWRKLSYTDMVRRRTQSPDQQLEADRGKSRNLINNFNMEIATCKLEYEWLKGCYTGVVELRMPITKLKAQLIKVGISNCVVRLIGGNLVLQSVKGDTRMEKIMADNRGKLGHWFSTV
ncbi:hypothetical protein Ancab_035908, partial [Ancistrocladus abbreviatus]